MPELVFSPFTTKTHGSSGLSASRGLATGGSMVNRANLSWMYFRQIEDPLLLAGVEELPKDGMWLVHCRSGARAAVACALLQRLGYQVTHVEGDGEAGAPGPNPL